MTEGSGGRGPCPASASPPVSALTYCATHHLNKMNNIIKLAVQLYQSNYSNLITTDLH